MILNILRGAVKKTKLIKKSQIQRYFSANSEDLYTRLGLSKGADTKDVKRAYKKATLKHHPDKGGNPEEFKKVQEAYEVLSDDNKRQAYDKYGMDGVNANAQAGGFGNQGPFGGQGGGNFNDYFDMFGGRGGGGPFGGQGGFRQQVQKMQLEPIMLEYLVTLEELYYGKNIEISYHRTKICGTCKGKGGKNVKTCGTCKGTGYTIKTRNMGGMMMQTQEVCHTCGGTGEVNFFKFF